MRKNLFRIAKVLALLFLLSGCGEEYYATPEKTLGRYVNARTMGRREDYEACLNSFRAEDRKWWDENWSKICVSTLGRDCPGDGIAAEAAVWENTFAPAGPEVTDVESSKIDGDQAVLVVQGQEIDFVKERGNWKMKGFWGVPEELQEKYPGAGISDIAE